MQFNKLLRLLMKKFLVAIYFMLSQWAFSHEISPKVRVEANADLAAVDDERKSTYKKIKNLALDIYCEQDSNCSSIPVGSVPCGGPSGHIIYSTYSGTQFLPELTSLAEKTRELGRKRNLITKIAGSCQYNAPRVLACIENTCTRTKDPDLRQ